MESPGFSAFDLSAPVVRAEPPGPVEEENGVFLGRLQAQVESKSQSGIPVSSRELEHAVASWVTGAVLKTWPG